MNNFDEDGHLYSAVIAAICILCFVATVSLIVAFT